MQILRLKGVSYIASWVLLGLLLGSCTQKSIQTEEYLIRIDSIIHPDTVAAQKPFAIKFYGIIGHTACNRFLRFETETETQRLKIWVVGERNIDTLAICHENLVKLEGKVFNAMAPDSGELVISVINPGLGNVLNSKVVVEGLEQY